MPVCAVSINSIVPETEVPAARGAAEIFWKGLPFGTSHNVAPEVPNSDALTGRLSNTTEIGPVTGPGPKLVTLSVCVKCPVVWFRRKPPRVTRTCEVMSWPQGPEGES